MWVEIVRFATMPVCTNVNICGDVCLMPPRLPAFALANWKANLWLWLISNFYTNFVWRSAESNNWNTEWRNSATRAPIYSLLCHHPLRTNSHTQNALKCNLPKCIYLQREQFLHFSYENICYSVASLQSSLWCIMGQHIAPRIKPNQMNRTWWILEKNRIKVFSNIHTQCIVDLFLLRAVRADSRNTNSLAFQLYAYERLCDSLTIDRTLPCIWAHVQRKLRRCFLLSFFVVCTRWNMLMGFWCRLLRSV